MLFELQCQRPSSIRAKFDPATSKALSRSDLYQLQLFTFISRFLSLSSTPCNSSFIHAQLCPLKVSCLH